MRIHSSMADARQPMQRVLSRVLLGKVPSAILRYRVERQSPVCARTAFRRRKRSGLADMGTTFRFLRLGTAKVLFPANWSRASLGPPGCARGTFATVSRDAAGTASAPLAWCQAAPSGSILFCNPRQRARVSQCLVHIDGAPPKSAQGREGKAGKRWNRARYMSSSSHADENGSSPPLAATLADARYSPESLTLIMPHRV